MRNKQIGWSTEAQLLQEIGVVLEQNNKTSSALPAGVSTSDLQITGNANLATLIALTNALETLIQSQNDSITLLRRIVKLLEPSGMFDAGNRQKVTVDSFTAQGATILGKVGIDQTAPGTTNKISIDQTTVGTTNNVTLFGLSENDYYQQMQRISYNTGIRSKLN